MIQMICVGGRRVCTARHKLDTAGFCYCASRVAPCPHERPTAPRFLHLQVITAEYGCPRTIAYIGKEDAVPYSPWLGDCTAAGTDYIRTIPQVCVCCAVPSILNASLHVHLSAPAYEGANQPTNHGREVKVFLIFLFSPNTPPPSSCGSCLTLSRILLDLNDCHIPCPHRAINTEVESVVLATKYFIEVWYTDNARRENSAHDTASID